MDDSLNPGQAAVLDRIAHGLEEERPAREPNERQSVVGLAMTVGFVGYLAADALPGGLSGATGFVIGFAGVATLAFAALLFAAALQRRPRLSMAEELDRLVDLRSLERDGDEWRRKAMLAMLFMQVVERDRHKDRGAEAADAQREFCELVELLQQMERKQPG